MVWKSLSEALESALIDALKEPGTGRGADKLNAPPPAATTRMGMVVRMGGDEMGEEESSPPPTRNGEGDPARSGTSKGRPRAIRPKGHAPSPLGRPVLVWSNPHFYARTLR